MRTYIFSCVILVFSLCACHSAKKAQKSTASTSVSKSDTNKNKTTATAQQHTQSTTNNQDTVMPPHHPGPFPLPVAPRYPDGPHAMYNFISAHLKYPEEARKNHISGIVYVDVTITKTGELTNIKIRKGLGYGCDEEALRIVKLMPKWTPGKQNGKAVDMGYNIPVKFVLGE